MADNFTQTVNLKEQMEKAKKAQAEARLQIQRQKEIATQPSITKAQKRAEAIDQVFENDSAEAKPSDFRTITRPPARNINLPWLKPVMIGVALVVVLFGAYWFLIRDNEVDKQTNTPDESKWYAVKLVTGETYYGQIADTSADPVVIERVYYDYDQISSGAAPTETDKEDTANLRLVKRGKETHGPEGTMDLVRTQVVYMEPLKEDSKVLKAILEYENK